MTQANGGPAFPLPLSDALRWNDSEYHGMTLRDYFAAKAMQGFIVGVNVPRAHNIARISYEIADAMLEARK